MNQSGYVPAATSNPQISAMNGVEMDSDMKTHISGDLDVTYSDSKKSHVTMVTSELVKAVMTYAV